MYIFSKVYIQSFKKNEDFNIWQFLSVIILIFIFCKYHVYSNLLSVYNIICIKNKLYFIFVNIRSRSVSVKMAALTRQTVLTFSRKCTNNMSDFICISAQSFVRIIFVLCKWKMLFCNIFHYSETNAQHIIPENCNDILIRHALEVEIE